MPGRKTDMADSEWLAVLARFGLVRASFIPPKDLRELRLISRYRRKLSAMCASEVNRLHKVLDDGVKACHLPACFRCEASHAVSAASQWQLARPDPSPRNSIVPIDGAADG